MPLQRRLPKVGFRSAAARQVAEVRLYQLSKVDGGVVDLAALKKANVVPMDTLRARIVASGAVTRAFQVKGAEIGVTKGARAAIEAAGGQVETA